jgi:hypothetical protein
MDTVFGLRVSSDPPGQGSSVKLKQEGQDHSSPSHPDHRTSVRFFGDQVQELTRQHVEHLDLRPYFSPRDRDLGQTFTTPSGQPFQLTAITLRVGPAINKAVGKDAPDAAVSIQFFTVSGTPQFHDVDGNTVINKDDPPHNYHGDYITGEHYTSVGVISGGKLPTPLEKDQWLRWEFPSDVPFLQLQPAQRYAFLVMFDHPAPNRELALANTYLFPGDFGGHGIRREGSIAQPWLDTSWVNDCKATSLPLDREVRLAQQPGTWGRPDVDTYRVLRLYIEGT